MSYRTLKFKPKPQISRRNEASACTSSEPQKPKEVKLSSETSGYGSSSTSSIFDSSLSGSEPCPVSICVKSDRSNDIPVEDKSLVQYKLEHLDSADVARTKTSSSIEDIVQKDDLALTETSKQPLQKSVKNVLFKPKLFSNRLNRGPKLTTSTFGKLSHEGRMQLMKKFGTLTPDHSSLTMLDLIYFNPKLNPMKHKSETKCIKKMEEVIISKAEEVEKSDAVPVPQLKLSSEGKVVIAPESLILNKNPTVETRCLIEEDEYNKKRKISNSNPDRQKWSFEETVNFYKALNSIGSDFETMKTIFPDRSRKSLKCKFKREEKFNGRLIDKMLGSRYAKFDVENLKKELAMDMEFRKAINASLSSRPVIGKNEPLPDDKPETQPKRKRRPRTQNFIENLNEDEENISFNIKRLAIPLKKPPSRVRKQIVVEEMFPISSESETESEYSFVNNEPNLDSSKGRITFNTNINIGGVKYTQSVIYNASNLDNPIDVNETIAHCDDEDVEFSLDSEKAEDGIKISFSESSMESVSTEENI